MKGLIHDSLCISLLTLFEFEYGYANADENAQIQLKQNILKVKRQFIVLPLSEAEAPIFGELKYLLLNHRQLKKENLKKHNVDLMLASTAIINACVLVSEDRLYDDLSDLRNDLKFMSWAD